MIELEAMKPLPVNYVLSRVELSWREATWAIDKGWLDSHSLVALAQAEIRERPKNPAVASLAAIGNERMSEAVKWAKAIAATEPPAEEEAIRSKWQFLVIDKIATDWPWDDQKIRLEEAYAEFEYPPDMKGFIGFIPASAETQKTWTDGTDPETLLQERVREYLESARKKFLKP